VLVGERPLVNAHRTPGYAAMNSGSIRLVIELFERYVGLRTSLVSTSDEARGKEIQVDFDKCLRRMLTVTIAHSLATLASVTRLAPTSPA
jgi:hypothetical protein